MDAVEEISGEGTRPRNLEPRRTTTPTEEFDEDDPPPVKPDCSAMTEEDAFDALKSWKKRRKAWTDRRARKRRQKKIGFGVGDLLTYSGDASPGLRMMTVVQQRRLAAGDTFQFKTTLAMRIAEEANLRGIQISTVRSDQSQMLVVGVDFYVKASNSERRGWVVTTAVVREGDGNMPDNAATRKVKWLPQPPAADEDDCIDLVLSSDEDDESKPANIKIASDTDDEEDGDYEESEVENGDDELDNVDSDDEKGIPRSPFLAVWLVPIIRPAIARAPMTSNSSLKEILKLYGNDFAFTKSILQKARTLARNEIFGDGKNNAQYVLALKDELELRGHFVQVLLSTRAEALNRLLLVVLAEEIRMQKAQGNANHGLGCRRNAAAFLNAWKEDNKAFIDEQLGTVHQNFRFVHGILFAPSTSKRTAPYLKCIYQADAAHLNWGKYTLYSAYGTTAEAQCSAIAFGILFGNEDKESWKQFWTFTVGVHPWMNSAGSTIITDQDKGSKAAISEVVPLAFNFHCSYHRRQNIMKHCRGGTQVYKALWMFNQLVGASTMAALNNKRDRCYPNMAESDRQYLDSVPDVEQYPAARCAMSPNIYMYGRSSSSGAESMNAANRAMRERSSVCLVNATMLLLRMEAERFGRMRDEAWAHEGTLTPRGRMLADDCSEEVPNHRDYTINREVHETYHEYTVRGNHNGSETQTVKVLKEAYYGVRGSSCTCMVPQTDGVPCRHIIAVAKSNRGEGLNIVNAMPYWWTTRCWRTQFPADEVSRCNIDLDYLKEKYEPDDSIRFFPDLIGQRKKGRPKKDKRAKSSLECALEKSRGKNVRKRKVSTEEALIEMSGGAKENLINGEVEAV